MKTSEKEIQNKIDAIIIDFNTVMASQVNI